MYFTSKLFSCLSYYKKYGNDNIIYFYLGSADAIITLVNGGANVDSHDKDGLTGKYRKSNIECKL